MSDRPDNSSGGRRRSGPLSDDTEQARTRREPSGRGADDATQRIPMDDATQRIPADDATRQIPTGEQGRSRGRGAGYRERAPRSSDTQEFEAPTRAAARSEETRKVRPSRSSAASSPVGRGERSAASGYTGYSTGYNEVLRDREEYLRDIYGGVDWLASFVGFVFTLMFAGLLGAGAGVFLLAPLGLQNSLGSGQLTSTTITGFAVVAGVVFFSFLFGGYISGRMARYDGGRNGAMVLLWTVLVAALLLVLSGVLGQVISGTPVGNVVGEVLSFGSTATSLLGGLGVSGVMIAGGVVLAALLGGTIGGRLGSRYHREIDYTP